MGCLFYCDCLCIIAADGQMKHWEPRKTKIDERNPWTKNPKPMAVETTAYALLTYSRKNLVSEWRLGIH